MLREAFYIATTGRPGPVLVDVAKDVFDAEFDYEYPETVELRGYSGVYTGQAYDIDRTVAALEQAKRPVLLTGGGIILADMAAPLWDVVQKTQVPVITSLMGKGAVPDSYDAHLGMVGMHGSYAANMAVTKCDLLIAVGTRFDDRITGDVENFAPNAQIVHFDIDKVEINKIVHADISVNGDLRWSLPLFDEKVRQSGVDFAAQFADWRKEVLAMNEAHPFATRDLPDAVSPQKLFEAVNSRLGADDFVVTDVASIRCGPPSSATFPSLVTSLPPAAWEPWATPAGGHGDQAGMLRLDGPVVYRRRQHHDELPGICDAP